LKNNEKFYETSDAVLLFYTASEVFLWKKVSEDFGFPANGRPDLSACFKLSEESRRLIDTAGAIEGFNRQLRAAPAVSLPLLYAKGAVPDRGPLPWDHLFSLHCIRPFTQNSG